MKRFITIILILCLLLASIPFSAYAKTSDMEIIISPDGLPEKSYTPTYSSIGQITLMSEDEALPSSFDARDYGWVTPLKRQEWGTCWSYAKISILETYNISQGFDDINADYSEAHLAWFGNTKSTDVNNPTYGDGVTVNFNPDDYFIAEYPNADKMGAYTIGATHSTAIGALARWSGIANEADFPPESEGPIIDETYRYNTDSGFVIKSAEWLNNITDVKNWVSNFGSASISFSYGNMHADFNGPDITWTYEYDYNRTSLHEVAIIGWDDYFPMREKYSYYETEWGRPDFMPPADGAWLCKDSNNDYLWISYYDASIIEIVGYTAQPSDTYRENYTYNGTGTQVYGTLQGPASVSNVFKTDEHEILSAVSTYTVEENQNLNIKIYTDINSNYTDPTQGTLALNYPIIVPKKGYHTIELPQDIKLNPNTYFSVVIEYEATNGVTRIPIEYDYDFGYENANFTYSSNKGESFIYVSSRSAWFYSEEQGAKNVFVQAFTNCDHQPETTTVSASCKEAGYSETKCTQCKEILESTVIPKLEHSYQWVIETMPTATTDGSKKQICAVCNDETDLHTIPATGFEATNGMAVDYAENIIYGLDAGAVSLDTYTAFVADGYEWIYTESENGFGTGTKAILKKGDETVSEYTVLIYGDINGDSWYDGEDAFIVTLIAKGLLDKEDVSTAIWTAADCNHDGVIDDKDVDLLIGAGLLLNKVDQTKATELVLNADYIEYVMLIDQSAGVHTGIIPYEDTDDTAQGTTAPKSNETVESDIFTTENNAEVIITNLFEFIKKIFAIVFSFIKP